MAYLFGLPPINQLLDKMHCHGAAHYIRGMKARIISTRSEIAEQGEKIREIKAEYQEGMKALQRQMRLGENRAVLEQASEYRKLTPDELNDLETLRDEMVKSKKQFWNHRKEEYELRKTYSQFERFEPRLERFFAREETNRRHAKRDKRLVIMNKGAIADCKGHGGCCSRNCNCCSRPRAILPGENVYAHCTDECACCVGYYESV